ncbi:MAG: outer membrane lipoprotein carrier protein LolA [Comamonas sp.]
MMRHWITAGSCIMALLCGAPAAIPEATAADAARTQQLLAQVRQQVRIAPVVRGQFEQLKTVQGFKQPLRSSGDFVVAQGKGIAWQVRQPFASTLLVRPDSLQSRTSEGAINMQLNAVQEPILRAINAMLFAVMSADLDKLTQYFEVTGQVQPKGWTLHLVPRDPMMAQWLQHVNLQGQQFVQEVQLQEARGDRSLIRIHDAVADTVLRPSDAAVFE